MLSAAKMLPKSRRAFIRRGTGLFVYCFMSSSENLLTLNKLRQGHYLLLTRGRKEFLFCLLPRIFIENLFLSNYLFVYCLCINYIYIHICIFILCFSVIQLIGNGATLGELSFKDSIISRKNKILKIKGEK